MNMEWGVFWIRFIENVSKTLLIYAGTRCESCGLYAERLFDLRTHDLLLLLLLHVNALLKYEYIHLRVRHRKFQYTYPLLLELEWTAHRNTDIGLIRLFWKRTVTSWKLYYQSVFKILNFLNVNEWIFLEQTYVLLF